MYHFLWFLIYLICNNFLWLLVCNIPFKLLIILSFGEPNFYFVFVDFDIFLAVQLWFDKKPSKIRTLVLELLDDLWYVISPFPHHVKGTGYLFKVFITIWNQKTRHGWRWAQAAQPMFDTLHLCFFVFTFLVPRAFSIFYLKKNWHLGSEERGRRIGGKNEGLGERKKE